MSPALPFAGSSPLAAFASAVEQLPGRLLQSSGGCNGTLPLEAACATETAAPALPLSQELWILCQALRAVWGWGDGSYCSENESAAT